MTTDFSSHPYDTKATAEQPWVNSKFSPYDSDIEIRSGDGFIFQLHRVVLGVTTGAFPGTEVDTGGEIVQLTEPANILGILFAFLYPKAYPDLHKESFEIIAAVAEAAGKYEVASAAYVCNELLLKFLPQQAPEILVHAIKHDYPRLINATLPHLARAPFLPVLEKLPPSYMLPWARYREAWNSVFKESIHYINNLPRASGASCHSYSSYSTDHKICSICQASIYRLVGHLEDIDTLSTLHDALQSPSTTLVLECCHRGPCSFLTSVTHICRSKIDKIPPFTTFLGLKL